MTFPDETLRQEALLCLIYFRGKKGLNNYSLTPKEAYHHLADFFRLSPHDRARPVSRTDKRSNWMIHVEGTRERLAQRGWLLRPPPTGLWRLSRSGVQQAKKLSVRYEALKMAQAPSSEIPPAPTYSCQLPLLLHQRYGRRDAFASVGIKYRSTLQHLNTGLSPRNSDGGFLIFITLSKDNFDSAYDYADEIFEDKVEWTTRRDRTEDHPDYVALRSPGTRISLFIRYNSSEAFLYLGEIVYLSHRQFSDDANRVQQFYTFELKARLSEALQQELTFGVRSRTHAPRSRAVGARRRPASFDEYKRAFSYALGDLDRTVIPEHHNFQVHLKKYLKNLRIEAEFERDYLDVSFCHAGQNVIGEIKVTTYLSVSQAFRTGIGQLLEYAHVKFRGRPLMLLFLDQPLDPRRLELATILGVAVVIKRKNSYSLLNPDAATSLTSLFGDDSKASLKRNIPDKER